MITKLNSSGKFGYEVVFFFLFLGFVVLFFYPQLKFSSVETAPQGCEIGQRPTAVEEINQMPAVPLVDIENQTVGTIDSTTRNSTFVLLRKNVIVPKASEIAGRNFFAEMNQISAGPSIDISGHPTVPHTVNLGEFPQKPGYKAFYPRWEANWGPYFDAFFLRQKMIFFVNQDPRTIYDVNGTPVYTVDIYVQKEKLPEALKYEQELFTCNAAQQAAVQNASEEGNLQVSSTEQSATAAAGFLVPEQNNSTDKKQLQLQYFLLQGQALATWSTHCKPAVYLYPPKQQLVNVKVKPAGHLIYTDPLYPENGWNVEAHPDGKIVNLGASDFMKQFDYLYFESKVPDEIIEKPTKGWIIASGLNNENWYAALENHFNEILPKLGLNEIQTKDFIEYWKKALPYSPYYFVGIIDQSNVDEIERLEILPKPDEVNRVRIYFERLDQPKEVISPMIDNSKFIIDNSKFQVVEWGGMVKNDLNHPFTCSQ